MGRASPVEPMRAMACLAAAVDHPKRQKRPVCRDVRSGASNEMTSIYDQHDSIDDIRRSARMDLTGYGAHARRA